MIDIHTHILHGIDDGAKTLKEAQLLIEAQLKQGVTKIVLTPHFKPKLLTQEEFLKARENQFQELQTFADTQKYPISFILGSEVYCESSMILNYDLTELCMEDSNLILIEFPVNVHKSTIFKIVEGLLDMGYNPIIAHVERYANIMDDLMNVYQLVSLGALIQTNATTVIKEDTLILLLYKAGLIHFVASDTHGLNHRAPNLKTAYQTLEDLGLSTSPLRLYGQMLAGHEDIQIMNYHKVKKFLGKYRISK